MFSIVASLRAKHQVDHQKALHNGLKKLGIDSLMIGSADPVRTKFVACWGWRKGRELRESGHEVLVMERGYIGDRFKYTSLGWNGLNGHAEFPDYEYDNGERFRVHNIDIKPWKKGGEYALILGQVPNDASLQGKDMGPWYEEKAREITLTHDIPVHFRAHPDVRRKGITQVVKGTVPSIGTLQDALNDAVFAVTYNSNSAVDSIINGVPCVLGDKGSMAHDMCGKKIGDIIMPDRTEWAHKLACLQWTMAEIESGEALKGIICKLG